MIQKCSSNQHYKNDGDKKISCQVKLNGSIQKIVGMCTKASLQVRLQWHIYDYSFKKDELNPIGVIVCVPLLLRCMGVFIFVLI